MDYDSMTNPKPRFYKRKTFYIPLLAFFILFLITIALLYKPLKLLIWTAIEYPKEKEYLLNLINEVEEDNVQEFAKTSQHISIMHSTTLKPLKEIFSLPVIWVLTMIM